MTAARLEAGRESPHLEPDLSERTLMTDLTPRELVSELGWSRTSSKFQ